jgi:hypothetical protein
LLQEAADSVSHDEEALKRFRFTGQGVRITQESEMDISTAAEGLVASPIPPSRPVEVTSPTNEEKEVSFF